MNEKILPEHMLIGISSCLLGCPVRFDGGHKKDRYIVNILSEYMDFYPICPEAEAGLGIPRPPIRLVGDVNDPQVVEVKNPEMNHTACLKQYSEKKMTELPWLTGFILKSKSPSCGLMRVRVYQNPSMPSQQGQGVFARILQQHFPALPIEEDGRLNDPRLRENFIERLYVYRRWQQMLAQGLTKKSFIQFHSEIKLSLMAHSVAAYQRLGQKLAHLKDQPLQMLANSYIDELMAAFKRMATIKGHTNVLHHCMGYLKKSLSTIEKQALLKVIDDFHAGYVPLVVPVTLLKHYFQLYPDAYMQQQTYLNPYPKELMLRNFL